LASTLGNLQAMYAADRARKKVRGGHRASPRETK